MTQLLRKQDQTQRRVKTINIGFACIEIVAFASKVNVTMFILMRSIIFICRGRHEGIANVETYRDRQGPQLSIKACPNT